MTDQNAKIWQPLAAQRSRLRNFIRRRVADPRDAQDILQDVFYKLVEATRLPMPIEHVTSWLFRVARNRITELSARRSPDLQSCRRRERRWRAPADRRHAAIARRRPEALYVRNVLLNQLELALDELPEEQPNCSSPTKYGGRSLGDGRRDRREREHIACAERYAVLHLRERLKSMYGEFTYQERSGTMNTEMHWDRPGGAYGIVFIGDRRSRRDAPVGLAAATAVRLAHAQPSGKGSGCLALCRICSGAGAALEAEKGRSVIA